MSAHCSLHLRHAHQIPTHSVGFPRFSGCLIENASLTLQLILPSTLAVVALNMLSLTCLYLICYKHCKSTGNRLLETVLSSVSTLWHRCQCYTCVLRHILALISLCCACNRVYISSLFCMYSCDVANPDSIVCLHFNWFMTWLSLRCTSIWDDFGGIWSEISGLLAYDHCHV